jgi:hypothetical protein
MSILSRQQGKVMHREQRGIASMALALAGCLPWMAEASTDLVTNGTFDNGVSGWTLAQADGYYWTGSGGNPGGALILNNSPGPVPQAAQDIAGLIVGATYEITLDARTNYNCCNSTTVPGAGVGVDGKQFDFFVYNNQAWTHQTFDFTYGGASSILVLSAQRNGTDSDGMFDNVSLKLVSNVPESGTYAMLLVGLGALGALRRLRVERG